MNYIDKIAMDIYHAAHPDRSGNMDEESFRLYRIYAVLLLSKAEFSEIELEDVHNAWSAWRAGTNPNHKSLVPFNELSVEVQELDKPYRDAIMYVAENMEIV